MKRVYQSKHNLITFIFLATTITISYPTFPINITKAENISRITIIVASQSAAEPQEPIEPAPPFTPLQENKPPVADAGGPYYGHVNQTIVLNASKSFDPDGEITGYRWDLNNDGLYDTEWITQPITTHTYSKVGNYTIKLQVKDNNNTLSNDTTVVHITSLLKKEILPIPVVTAPNIAFSNQNITFDASKSFDPDGEIVNYIWIFRNKTKSGVKVNHSFNTAGSKNIILMVTDNDNLTNSTVFIIKIISIIRELSIENTLYGLVDLDGDNQIDAITNLTNIHLIPVNMLYYNNQLVYLIDTNEDGVWDYAYYYEQDEIKPYIEKETKEKPLNLNLYIFLVSIAIALTAAMFLLKKRNQKKR